MNKIDVEKVHSTVLMNAISTIQYVGFMVLGFLILSLFFVSPAHAIKKCKDADGKWHYGDFAIKACEQSKVTTLSDRGTIKHQKPAPKTQEELLEIEKNKEETNAEQQRLLLKEREKTRILSIYETEADIDRQRDNQLYSVDSNIAVHNTFLESMDEQIEHEEKKLAKIKSVNGQKKVEARIASAKHKKETYSKEVSLLHEERKAIVEKFKKEKEVYLELTKSKTK